MVFSSRPELELKLRNMEEEHAVKEAKLRETVTHLTKDNGRLLNLSAERMQMIQVKGTDFLQSTQSQINSVLQVSEIMHLKPQEKDKEIQKLGKKWKYEKECRMKAEERWSKHWENTLSVGRRQL